MRGREAATDLSNRRVKGRWPDDSKSPERWPYSWFETFLDLDYGGVMRIGLTVAGIVAALCWFIAVFWWTSQTPTVRDRQAMELIHAVL